MSRSARLGRWGEHAAEVFLELCGYRCVDRRYRRPGGEIDLVMRDGATLVFVEVKTRGPDAVAPAEAWLSRAQLRRLRRLSLQWLAEHDERQCEGLRFDLVAVTAGDPQQGASIRHLPGIG
jgi:putative endonuclease